MAESTSAEQAAYQASFNKAKKQQARDKGAADAGGDPIVEAARQRALAPQQPAALNRPASGTVQATKPSGEFIQRPDGSRVPAEFYSLSPEHQQRFNQLLKGEEAAAESESLALKYSKMVGDQQEEQAQRITALESQLGAALSAMEALQRRMKSIDTTIEVQQSDELTEQQVQLAQMTVNLQAVGAEQESNHQRRIAESAQQAADHEARLAAMEQPIAELEGRVKSSVVLMGERSNAVISALGESESRQQKVSVQLVELENRSDALGSPITRPEMKAMVTTEVTAEVKAQAPELIDQQIRDDKELGVINPGGQTMDRAYMQQKRSDAEAFRANATRGLG